MRDDGELRGVGKADEDEGGGFVLWRSQLVLFRNGRAGGWVGGDAGRGYKGISVQEGGVDERVRRGEAEVWREGERERGREREY